MIDRLRAALARLLRIPSPSAAMRDDMRNAMREAFADLTAHDGSRR